MLSFIIMDITMNKYQYYTKCVCDVTQNRFKTKNNSIKSFWNKNNGDCFEFERTKKDLI